MVLSLLEKIELFDPNLPLAEARTIPSVWYFDPEVHAAERSSVFAGTWQQIGRLDQLAEPGSFVTEDVAGEPILVVRDQERTLRAFSNVCRHRAARVAREPAGKVSRLRCRYHGWTYDLAGRLRHAGVRRGRRFLPRRSRPGAVAGRYVGAAGLGPAGGGSPGGGVYFSE